jgi:hypothetical protein
MVNMNEIFNKYGVSEADRLNPSWAKTVFESKLANEVKTMTPTEALKYKVDARKKFEFAQKMYN